MIDWKDVNKELPNENCDNLLFKIKFKKQYSLCSDIVIEDDSYKIGKFKKESKSFYEEWFINDEYIAYSKSNDFVQSYRNKIDHLSPYHKLTHWSYINEPNEKEDK